MVQLTLSSVNSGKSEGRARPQEQAVRGSGGGMSGGGDVWLWLLKGRAPWSGVPGAKSD